MTNDQIEIDIVAKKAALSGIYAAMEMHVRRSEALAVEMQDLQNEIDELETRLVK